MVCEYVGLPTVSATDRPPTAFNSEGSLAEASPHTQPSDNGTAAVQADLSLSDIDSDEPPPRASPSVVCKTSSKRTKIRGTDEKAKKAARLEDAKVRGPLIG